MLDLQRGIHPGKGGFETRSGYTGMIEGHSPLSYIDTAPGEYSIAAGPIGAADGLITDSSERSRT